MFELRAAAGKDPLTGKYRPVTRRFRGTLRRAKSARAALVVEVTQGKHHGARATVDELFVEWVKELERKDRSPRTIAEYERRYRHDMQQFLGTVPVTKVTTKMLTDLYGAHQRRGAAPGSVRKIHATISSMMSQACRWGWRDSNPAEWAEPPPLEAKIPVVPTPDEVARLIEAARASRRPEQGDVIYLAATTGARRGEICALRRSHFDPESRALTIARNIVKHQGSKVERPTKNRRLRLVAIDPRAAALLEERIEAADANAKAVGVSMVDDPYLFATDVRGAEPWDPDTVTQYFARLRRRTGLDHLEFKGLRRFMDTYGQELGFSLAQVSMRAGHDPAVASKHYTGRVMSSDRDLADAIGALVLDAARSGDDPET
ncbi:MAG: site-specific integrase [Actinomycetota bacterium]